ncbi:hypothetical protein B0H13DRAFT_2554310 [Mycena leptocephala]|nr:hypothetical protein B0H13DRAFT_2554310 [Mycena leptocephala]
MLANLEADRARVADLEAQISHLERSLSALREEKMLAQERLDSYKYPVLTLPNETVSGIFMHFLPPYPLCPPLTGLLSPTLLTHICRRWQEIALSTPALWRAIGSYRYHIPVEIKAHIFDLWLKRSRFCPLSLRVEAETGVAAILAVVAPHRARWEHLELDNLSPSHLPIINGRKIATGATVSLLRHLDLQICESPAIDVLAFRVMPLLRSVILNDHSLNVILPWAQLMSLTLVRVYPRESVPVLQKTSNLVRCQLELCVDHGNDQPGPDIPLPCLESLTLADAGSGPVIDFLETFIVPALRRLEIPEGFLGPNPIDSVTGFVSKSRCKLAELHIDGPRSLPKQSYRKAFPSIRKFSFSDASEGDD